MKNSILLTSICVFVFLLYSPGYAGITVGHSDTTLSAIPNEWITEAKKTLHIAYNHTSHGSQIITGLNALKDYPAFSNKFKWVNDSIGDIYSLSLSDKGIPGATDLSQGDNIRPGDPDGVAEWARDTFTFLVDENNYHVNVVIWSWCNIAGHNIPLYLDSMEWLISLFGEGGNHARAAQHPVQFVFMTGHANGDGIGGSSNTPNDLIRKHCKDNNRILFDFADIENYDPDNIFYLDKRVDDALNYDSTQPYTSGDHDANWANEYLTKNSGSELDLLVNGTAGYSGCGTCAHSPEGEETPSARLNCVLKGRAAWHLFAQLAGWDPNNKTPPSPPQPTGDSYPWLMMLLLSD